MKLVWTAMASLVVIAVLGPLPALAQGTADVTISVSASQSPVTADSKVTYTVQISNSGPDTASRTEVYDRLPPDVMFNSASQGGTYATSTNRVHWAEGSLQPSVTVSEWVTVTPIHPVSPLTDSAWVRTSSLDPTTPTAASTDITVQPEPGVQYISVRDASLTPSFRDVPLGGTLQWDFFGPGLHEITDAHGLGFLDTGAIAPVNYSRFTFDVSAEIRTQDLDAFPENTGKIVIPVQVTPASGNVDSTFTVTWALSSPPPALVEDIQIRRPDGQWVQWRRNESPLLADTFQPDAGPGAYAFRSRLRSTSTNAHSRFGPPVAIQVA